MTTIKVHISTPQDFNQPSTSYLHLSGHNIKDYQYANTSFVEEDGEENGGDEMMDEQDGSIAFSSQKLATTGQAIASATTFMRGHGAFLNSSATRLGGGGDSIMIHSSLCGLIRKTNKLISVTPLKSRYSPEVGDLVIGRITDLQPGNKKWKVDIQSNQDSNLLLSSINLPGGIQRRKLESDELEMRNFFKEGDLVVAEIQSIFSDGSTNLHTRSLNYGKLRNGQIVIVNSSLIQRLKSHFVRLDDIGLEILIGLNGVIWVSMLNKGKVNVTTGTGRDIEAVYSDVNELIPDQVRCRISRMLDIVTLFSCHHHPITDLALKRAYDVSINLSPLAEDDIQINSHKDEEAPISLTSDIMAIIIEDMQNAKKH